MPPKKEQSDWIKFLVKYWKANKPMPYSQAMKNAGVLWRRMHK